MNDIFSLKNKVIVVTGGTGILGGAFVDGIVNAGGTVGVLGRNEKKATDIVTKIKKNGGEAIALIADVTNEEQLERACQKVLSEYGKIDGLVNAAGGNIPEAIVQSEDEIFKLDMNAIQKVMQLNLLELYSQLKFLEMLFKKMKAGVLSIFHRL